MLELGRLCGALALVTGVLAVGCGDDEDPAATTGQGGSTSSSSSSSASTGGMGGMGGMGGEYVCAPDEGTTLALTKVDFGVGLNGQWKKVGLNIDGKESTANSTDLCQPNSMATPDTAYPDGDDGIDNSFGKNLLPLIVGSYPEWPADVNGWLTAGQFNALMKMYCVPPTGDAPELITKVFGGTELGTTPKYDGTDEWPVAPELIADMADPESSTIIFEKSSITGSKFDSGKNETFILTVPMDYAGNYTTVKLTLHAAQITMTLSEDRKTATGGMIAGVLDATEFLDQVKKIAWMLEICDEDQYQYAVAAVLQASDIMTDGTQDPTKVCDGISIGIAFEMKEVLIGEVGPAADTGMACP